MIARAKRNDAQHNFIRLAARVGADDRARGLLRELCQWREREAQTRNRPRKHIVDDPLLIELARERPQSRPQLENLPAWQSHRGRVGANPLLKAVLEFELAEPCSLPPECEDLATYKGAMKALKQVVAEVARSVSLEPAMLAPRRVLEGVVVHSLLLQREGLPEEFDGWRGDLLSEPLMKCLHGA